MDLRWIKINGEKTLQYLVSTTLESGEVISMRWEDVPLVSTPEKKIEITEKQFDEAYLKASEDSSRYPLKNDIKKALGF